MRRTSLTATIALASIAGGCATGSVSRADLKTQIQIQYGRVDEVERVRLESHVASNAIIGGVVGALVGKRNRLAGAAVGAGAAGLVTAAAEGVQEAYAYTVRLDAGTMVKVVVDHGDVGVGQCVAVEQGRTAIVRVVSPGACHPEFLAAATAPEVQARAQDHASACDQAKEAVLAARTSEELDLLAKKAGSSAATEAVGPARSPSRRDGAPRRREAC